MKRYGPELVEKDDGRRWATMMPRDLGPAYLVADVDALLKKLSDARLEWGMLCGCPCKACEAVDAAVRDLMGSGVGK
jgi:hypothetical protein